MGLEPEGKRDLRRIVCDTAPLVSLQESDLLDILPLAGQIYVPPAVKAELRTLDPIPEWLKIAALDAPSAQEARAWVQAGILDPGESEAIALVRHRPFRSSGRASGPGRSIQVIAVDFRTGAGRGTDCLG